MPVICGIHPVKEALATGGVERLLVAEGKHHPRIHELVTAARGRGIEVRAVPRAVLDRHAPGANHQGVVAFSAGRALCDLAELLRPEAGTPLLLLLDGVEDPHNLGAILRSADGAGATGVILPKRRSAPLSDAVWRASAGAAAYVPVARVVNVAETIRTLQAGGVRVVGADAAAGRPFFAEDLTGPVALVLGREGQGLHRLVRERCDALVSLPMRGRVSSLNVSVSAAILLYEAVRQRATAL
ncbi:MAG TPA: 23S rRNA (guanosine(2251)-2'-O)-methyltransferase RlmB [Acidobacteriota bacterium]|nr:23S rRNA (guanosine(2251)-2'-O)-methyltransferase RlmB [Acidobacteriota bacterium]HQF85638.1 23S rRNA (guanosine(2251)-2'-O)-methyltransferase RlmB [Acidobacteriota bacterium]HQG91118.1 23S rRNA (guanosine(2251)-2'-O)-methyltransferase RlmB [Acidobacteriota bacterium]HQK88836.1 23S rRNA (guanosine(2251)-2'-O)-methyltransferase RlmB [Acidobacteriota bacterium]